MFYLWRRMGEEEKQHVWRLYGWFSALMMCGSCVGVVTWAARMMTLVNAFNGNDLLSKGTFVEGLSFVALTLSWNAAYWVTYAIEFLCLTTAKLMVLDRMSDFAAPQGDGARQWWAAGGRIVMAAVVLGNVVGLAANVAAAVHGQKSAEAMRAASAYFDANNMIAREYFRSGREESELAGSVASVQRFSEIVVLLLIVAAFAVVGIVSARRFSSALTLLDTAGPEMAADMRLRQNVVGAAKALGRQMRKEVVVTTAFVFVAFLLRSVVSTMLAVVLQLQNSANVCPGSDSCDASCYNVFALISTWFTYSPEFLPIVVLISSPIALLVALWGMTSKRTRQLMKSSKRQAVPLRALQ